LGACRSDAYGWPQRAGQVQAAAGAAERLGLDAREHRGTVPGSGAGLLFRRVFAHLQTIRRTFDGL